MKKVKVVVYVWHNAHSKDNTYCVLIPGAKGSISLIVSRYQIKLMIKDNGLKYVGRAKSRAGRGAEFSCIHYV